VDDNPYRPPKYGRDNHGLDRFGETRNSRDELIDWSGFFFVVIIMFIVLFHHILIDFFIEIFNRTL
jgi:hypothetical protein